MFVVKGNVLRYLSPEARSRESTFVSITERHSPTTQSPIYLDQNLPQSVSPSAHDDLISPLTVHHDGIVKYLFLKLHRSLKGTLLLKNRASEAAAHSYT